VLFPIVVAIVSLQLNPNIWLSPLMVLGTQWYILFNVIARASAFPTDLREASTLYRLRTWQWWREAILPGIFPLSVPKIRFYSNDDEVRRGQAPMRCSLRAGWRAGSERLCQETDESSTHYNKWHTSSGSGVSALRPR
jgi:hypothetical protein